MGSIYEIDFNTTNEYNTPPRKRGNKNLAWLKSLVAPLNTLREAFFSVFFVDVAARAKRSGQKIILEDTLRTVFSNQSIYIDNTGDDIQNYFFYRDDEGYPPIYFNTEAEGSPKYLYTESEYATIRKFKVFAPSAVLASFSQAQIEAEVDKYRPAGTTYEVIIF